MAERKDSSDSEAYISADEGYIIQYSRHLNSLVKCRVSKRVYLRYPRELFMELVGIQ